MSAERLLIWNHQIFKVKSYHQPKYATCIPCPKLTHFRQLLCPQITCFEFETSITPLWDLRLSKAFHKKLKFRISFRSLFRPYLSIDRSKCWLKRLWCICLVPIRDDRAKTTHLKKLRGPWEPMPYWVPIRREIPNNTFLTGGKPLWRLNI